MEHHQEEPQQLPAEIQQSKENVPVDLDEFPSIHEATRHGNGIPQTILTTPYDDLSTIDNDTIGHTVHPWDLSSQDPRHHPLFPTNRRGPRRVDATGEQQSLPHSSLPPALQEGYDYEDPEWIHNDNATPVTGVSSSSNPAADAKTGMALSYGGGISVTKGDSTTKDENDKRRFRCYLIAAIVGPMLSALIVGATMAFLLRDKDSSNNTTDNRSNTSTDQANNVVGGGITTFQPTESPNLLVPSESMAPMAAPTISTDEPLPEIPTTTPGGIDFGPIATAAPSVLISTLPDASENPDTSAPTVTVPVMDPTLAPTQSPVTAPITTTTQPTRGPTRAPTALPTRSPTRLPTALPATNAPTRTPTSLPALTNPPVLPPAGGGTASLSSDQTAFVNLLRTSTSSSDYWGPVFGAVSTNVVDTSSPQYQALAWLTGDPNFGSYSTERRLQRYALGVLAFGVDALTEEMQQGGWLDYNTHECDWYATRQSCSDGSSMLERLELRNLGLSGQLPVELGLLSNSLVHVYIQGNEWSGTLPATWGRDFSNLKRLQLTSAGRLEGTLPIEWRYMTSLQVLGLGRNQLSGSLPKEWAVADDGSGNLVGMKSLTTLGLEYNLLTGQIPPPWGGGQLPALRELFLDYNSLTGRVPVNLWNNNAWESVNLSNNDLTGTISDKTCNIPTLVDLVADCSTGSIECACCTECT